MPSGIILLPTGATENYVNAYDLLPTWPAEVPSGARDGWQMPSMFLAPVGTEMEGGNQRLRQRPGSNVATITYPLQPLSLDEWAALEDFLRNTLNNGASRFWMSVLTGSGYLDKVVQLNEGKSPSVARDGDLINVVMQLRVYGM